MNGIASFDPVALMCANPRERGKKRLCGLSARSAWLSHISQRLIRDVFQWNVILPVRSLVRRSTLLFLGDFVSTGGLIPCIDATAAL